MEEELQPLIDRIQQEGTEKAEAQAKAIIEDAETKASAIIETASAEAKSILTKADNDAQAYTVRSRETLEQSCRDMLLSLEQAIERVFSDLVKEDVVEALDESTLQEMLVKLAESYGNTDGRSSEIEILLGGNDKQRLATYLKDRLAERLRRGVEIHIENELYSGFKVSFSEGSLYHDFTLDAIAETISTFLRPELLEIVKQAAALANGERGQE